MCYALCKHSVIKETHNGIAEYDRLTFVEFLELIGRIATFKYIGTDFEQEHLLCKIEYILDLILKIVSVDRLDPISQEVDSSESDHDY